MKKNIIFVTVAATVLFIISSAMQTVSAQNQAAYIGNDPTNRGRYHITGRVRPVQGANVLRQLPAGVSCQPAGELSGQSFYNSTKYGMADVVELTDAAQVAFVGNDLYLCYCVAGFNKIIPVETPPAPPQQPVAKTECCKVTPKVEQSQSQSQVVNTYTDVCPNIQGVQPSYPPGYSVDMGGNCVLISQPQAEVRGNWCETSKGVAILYGAGAGAGSGVGFGNGSRGRGWGALIGGIAGGTTGAITDNRCYAMGVGAAAGVSGHFFKNGQKNDSGGTGSGRGRGKL